MASLARTETVAPHWAARKKSCIFVKADLVRLSDPRQSHIGLKPQKRTTVLGLYHCRAQVITGSAYNVFKMVPYWHLQGYT